VGASVDPVPWLISEAAIILFGVTKAKLFAGAFVFG